MATYLVGTNIAPRTAKEARSLVGAQVTYLRSCDIDRSGRGYFFPHTGRVTDAHGRNICIDDSWFDLKSIVEMVRIEETAA